MNENTSSYEIDQHRQKCQRELKEAIGSREVLEQESLDLSRQILELEIKKNILQGKLKTARTNISQLSINIKLLDSEFWALKNDGR